MNLIKNVGIKNMNSRLKKAKGLLVLRVMSTVVVSSQASSLSLEVPVRRPTRFSSRATLISMSEVSY